MKNNSLPITTPIITGLIDQAIIFSTIDINDNRMMGWVANNYIQLQMEKFQSYWLYYCFAFLHAYDVALKSCPWLFREGVNRKLVHKRWPSIIEFIKDCIDNGYYVSIGLDEFYIKEYDNYGKYHNIHTNIIYAYDDEKGVVKIGDFFKGRRFYYTSVTYDEIINANAFSINNESVLYDNELYECAFLFRKDDFVSKYNFSIDATILLLEDYINAKNSHLRYLSFCDPSIYDDAYKYVFGIEIYKYLKVKFEHFDHIDRRSTVVLEDHKLLMYEIVKYLFKTGYIKNVENILQDFIDIYDKSKILKNLSLKYDATKSETTKQRIYNTIDDIKQHELLVLKNLLSKIITEPCLHYTIDTTVDYKSVAISYSGEEHNSTANFVFYGTDVYVNAKKDNKSGLVHVFLDGEIYTELNLYSEELVCESIDFAIKDLPPGFHKLTMRSINNSPLALNSMSISCSGSKGKSNSAVEYMGLDDKTKGNWQNVYGKCGYLIPTLPFVKPIYGDCLLKDYHVYHYNNPDENEKYLYDLSGTNSINAYICSNDYIDLDILVCGSKEKDVALYLYNDIDDEPKTGKLTIFDEDKNVLYAGTVDVISGVYYKFKVCGLVTMRIELLIEDYERYYKFGKIAGIFFD